MTRRYWLALLLGLPAAAKVAPSKAGRRHAVWTFCGLPVTHSKFPIGDRVELRGALPPGCTIRAFPLAGLNKPLTFKVGMEVLEECLRLGITPVCWHLTVGTQQRILKESLRATLPSFARYEDIVGRSGR
jgi:hypothetical protein